MIPATIPKGLKIERVSLGDLPAGWRERAARERVQAIGADRAKRTANALPDKHAGRFKASKFNRAGLYH